MSLFTLNFDENLILIIICSIFNFILDQTSIINFKKYNNETDKFFPFVILYLSKCFFIVILYFEKRTNDYTKQNKILKFITGLGFSINEEIETRDLTIKNYLILFFCSMLDIFNYYLPYFSKYEINNQFFGIFFIFSMIFNHFILKTNYYIHHYFSIILMVFLYFLYSILVYNILDEKFEYNLILTIISPIFLALKSTLEKYLIENHHLNRLYILSFQSIVLLSAFLLFNILNLCFDVIDLKQFYSNYFMKCENFNAFLYMILIISFFFKNSLEICILSLYSTFFVDIPDDLGDFMVSFYNLNSLKKRIGKFWILLIPIINLIFNFPLFTFTELIICNFCGLNKNIEIQKDYFEKVGIAKDKNLLIEKEKENDFKFDF